MEKLSFRSCNNRLFNYKYHTDYKLTMVIYDWRLQPCFVVILVLCVINLAIVTDSCLNYLFLIFVVSHQAVLKDRGLNAI